jgi:exosortase
LNAPEITLALSKQAKPAGFCFSAFQLFTFCLFCLPFAYLWFRLTDNLRLEWSTNPQYAYGWLVPILCLGLLLRRIVEMRTASREAPPSDFSVSAFQRFSILTFACLALLYLPTRLIEGAVPEWRPIQWLLGLEAIGLTLGAICLLKGRGWFAQLAFPICFFLVAIPWPTILEIPIIQTLTRLDGAFVVEILGILGVPILQHGNLLEVGTGVIGIDEACSGIRSFQSSLMISLFLGEFYRLSVLPRLVLVPTGFALSFAFNVIRTAFLTWVAAHKGVDAIAKYHDPAGLSILIACTFSMWLLGWFLSNRKPPNLPSSLSHLPASVSPWSVVRGPWSVVRGLSILLLVWILLVEIAVAAWYHAREAQIKPGPKWALELPRDNPTFQALSVTPKTEYLLRFDEAKQGAWKESDGTSWQGFYFSWLPGRVAGYLAKRHTPDICLPASGCNLRGNPDLMVINVHGVELPVRHYLFEGQGNVIQVFHCRWEAGAGKSAYVEGESSRFNLVRAIWAGRGKHGQKVLEFMALGVDDPEQAKQSLLRQLDKMIKVERS